MVLNEPVLVIPEVLALLGDNPMQSEFACHIGLRGKLFCRACWVKGTEALDPTGSEEPAAPDEPPDPDRGAESDAGSVNSSNGSDSEAGSNAGAKKKGKGKRVQETIAQMVNRVKAFMKVVLSYISPFRHFKLI